MSVNITFDSSVKEEILGLLDKSVDNEGYIVEKENLNQRVLTQEGEEITLNEFGGFKKGSEIFVKNDIVSLIKFSKTQK